MTGFGRSENQNDCFTCKVEVRSVNNRFLDVNTRLPKTLSPLEQAVKSSIKKRCARGSFDVSIALERNNGTEDGVAIKPNIAMVSQYVQAMNQIKTELGLAGDIDINALVSLRDIVKNEVIEPGESEETFILETLAQAVDMLVEMRHKEGEHLLKDLEQRIGMIASLGQSIKGKQPEILKEHQERLSEKIKQLTNGMETDPIRLAQEIAILADRCDVTEEVTRLESHLEQFEKLIQAGGIVGRKLEFITQEINRETNTIGSKTNDYQVSQWVIEIKSTLEQIREQLQNIE